MKKTLIAIIAILVVATTIVVGTSVAVSAAEKNKYEAGLASALETNNAAERELAAKCLSAVEAAGVEVLDSGFIASNCDGKYHTKFYFLSDAGVEWVPVKYGEKPENWHFNVEHWAFVA